MQCPTNSKAPSAARRVMYSIRTWSGVGRSVGWLAWAASNAMAVSTACTIASGISATNNARAELFTTYMRGPLNGYTLHAGCYQRLRTMHQIVKALVTPYLHQPMSEFGGKAESICSQ